MNICFILQNFPWAEADEKEKEVSNPKIIPVKSIKTAIFDVSVAIFFSGLQGVLEVDPY